MTSKMRSTDKSLREERLIASQQVAGKSKAVLPVCTRGSGPAPTITTWLIAILLLSERHNNGVLDSSWVRYFEFCSNANFSSGDITNR